MFRTIFMIGLFALAGLFLFKLLFGVLFLSFGIIGWLLRFAIQALIVGAIIYVIVRVFSPDTARRWRDRWSGPTY